MTDKPTYTLGHIGQLTTTAKYKPYPASASKCERGVPIEMDCDGCTTETLKTAYARISELEQQLAKANHDRDNADRSAQQLEESLTEQLAMLQSSFKTSFDNCERLEKALAAEHETATKYLFSLSDVESERDALREQVGNAQNFIKSAFIEGFGCAVGNTHKPGHDETLWKYSEAKSNAYDFTSHPPSASASNPLEPPSTTEVKP